MKNNLSSSFFSKAANKLASPVKQAISSVLDSLNSQDLDEEEFIKIEQSIMVLFLYVMKSDGDVSDNEIETVSNYFKENYGQGSLNRFRVLLQKKELDSIEECCKNLESFTHSEKVDILKALINVGYSDSQFKEDEKGSVLEISKQLGIHSDDLNSALAEAEKAYRTRSSFIKSSAGLIAAFVIILIFILTATYLKSVLFGLILAYFFLPLQRWYAESFFNNGAIARFMNFLGSCKNACSKVVKGIRGIFPAKASKVVTENQEDSDESERRLQLKRSCHATVLTVILSSAAAVVLVLWISSGYFTAAKETLKEVDENKDTKPVIHNLLDRLNPNLIEIPIIAKAVEFAEEFVADEEK
ncbi:MAG: TerB family tellurite resistance protein, partial [Lentisphaeraceae bacterium]|nr:TerB family tellurite resistance protein [Lentisphaeraceae bacterium]